MLCECEAVGLGLSKTPSFSGSRKKCLKILLPPQPSCLTDNKEAIFFTKSKVKVDPVDIPHVRKCVGQSAHQKSAELMSLQKPVQSMELLKYAAMNWIQPL